MTSRGTKKSQHARKLQRTQEWKELLSSDTGTTPVSLPQPVVVTPSAVYPHGEVMLTVAEIARRCGVSRQCVYGWTREVGFPSPVSCVKGVAVWEWSSVRAWRNSADARRRHWRSIRSV